MPQNASAEGAGRRTLHEIRDRIVSKVSRQFTLEEALTLSLGSAVRDPSTVVESLFNARLWSEVRPHQSNIAVQPHEIATLFGGVPPPSFNGVSFGLLGGLDISARSTPSSPTPPDIAAAHMLSFHARVAKRLQEALHTTLTSEAARSGWDRPFVRIACVLGMYMVEPKEVLVQMVGEPTRSDARKFEDMLYDIQDEEDSSDAHLMPVCETIRILAKVWAKEAR